MARRFAAETSVPVERTRAEIEILLARHGATAFGYRTADGIAVIEFACQDRMVRFTLPLPKRDEPRFHQTEVKKTQRSEAAAVKAWEQSCRQSWRALQLAIKAKLEAVAAGIAEFEEEFLAYVIDPCTRQTVGELMRPELQQRYLGSSSGATLFLPGPV